MPISRTGFVIAALPDSNSAVGELLEQA